MPFECNTSYPLESVAILYVLKTHHIQNSPLRQRDIVCLRERGRTQNIINIFPSRAMMFSTIYKMLVALIVRDL